MKKIVSIVASCFVVVGLALGVDYEMYGIDNETDELVTIDITNGDTTVVAPLGIDIVGANVDGPFGFDYNPNDNLLYMAQGASLYSVNPTDGAVNLVWSNALPVAEGSWVSSIGFSASGEMYLYVEVYAFNQGSLYSFDLASGTSTLLGGANNYPNVLGGDLSADGTMWVSDEWDGKIYRIRTSDGAEVWAPNGAIWYTGNGAGDLMDMDESSDGKVRVLANDHATSTMKLITVNPTTGLADSSVTINRFI